MRQDNLSDNYFRQYLLITKVVLIVLFILMHHFIIPNYFFVYLFSLICISFWRNRFTHLTSFLQFYCHSITNQLWVNGFVLDIVFESCGSTSNTRSNTYFQSFFNWFLKVVFGFNICICGRFSIFFDYGNRLLDYSTKLCSNF